MRNSQKEASISLEAVLNTLTECLMEGQEVRFTGFGSFPVRMTPVRKRIHPITGEKIQVPAHRRVSFKASEKLKDALW